VLYKNNRRYSLRQIKSVRVGANIIRPKVAFAEQLSKITMRLVGD